MTTSRVWVLHENPGWLTGLAAAFDAESVPLGELSLAGGTIDLSAAPPPGVFWSRLSASAHSRGNTHAREFARAQTTWLAAHGRRVVNGRAVVELEVSKIAQHTALAASGIDVPRTVAALGPDAVADAAALFDGPVIVKPNSGGKGIGVSRFDTAAQAAEAARSGAIGIPVDGITLVQEYLPPAGGIITRAEFVGGRLVYAVDVDVTSGSFELCPADACVVDRDGLSHPVEFRPRAGFADHPLVPAIERVLAANGIEIAGVEFLVAPDGRHIVYDINTNTNYNPAAEASVALPAATAVARFLGGLLAEERARDTGGRS